MKKYIGIVLAIVMVLGLCGMAAATDTDSLDITIQIKVLPWVMARPRGALILQMNDMPQNVPAVTETLGPVEEFYANLPVTVTISGDNPAGDRVPRFAREELETDGTGKGRYDRLSTHIIITTHVNAFQPNEPNYDSFVTTYDNNGVNPQTPGSGTWTGNSFTLPTPHDGEVWQEFTVTADRHGPIWGSDQRYFHSADAGVYELTLTKTLVANTTTLQTRDLW